MRFGIVVSEWNSNITGPLLEGAVTTLKKHGAKDENILVQTVPGCLLYTSKENKKIPVYHPVSHNTVYAMDVHGFLFRQ